MSAAAKARRRGPARPPSDAFMSDLAARVGAAWFAACRDELRRDGRSVQGGWPGTKAEARGRVLRSLGPELARSGLSVPTADGIDLASTAVYAAAREAWLSEARRDDAGDRAG